MVARMLLWCSGRLLECCFCMLLQGCCWGVFGGCQDVAMVFRVVARVLLLYVVMRMLLGNIWWLLGCCYGVQGGC